MSILLADLVTELQGKVPARNSIPSSAQYAKVIKDAAADFSRRCSREKISTVSILSGTAVYDMPADFLRMIAFYDPATYGGVMITPGGLVPTTINPYSVAERRTFANGKMTIVPTPTYTLDRLMRYAAGWALTGGTTYADMTEAEAAIVMVKAEADSLTLQLNSEGSGVLAYRIGDESFDKSGGVQSMAGQRNSKQAEYLQACESYNGSIIIYGGPWQS